MGEVRVVEGLRRPGGEIGDARDQLGREPLADERRGRGGRRARLRGDRADDEPGVADDVTLHPESDGDAEHREIERAAPPELQVRGAPRSEERRVGKEWRSRWSRYA